jgi:hypothetical protein
MLVAIKETRESDAAHAAAALDDLLQDIRQRRKEFEAQRISPDIIQRFKEVGVYRALVAKRFGGDEKSPAEFCRLIETISQADGSAGWVASFGIGGIYLAALPLATLEKLYANGPDVVFAGGIFPPQPAELVEGGFKVNGRWSWGSGSMGAEVVGAGILPKNAEGSGLPRMAVMPREKVQIVPNWDVMGLLGTGSHDIVVKDVVVPEEWTFVRGGARPSTRPCTATRPCPSPPRCSPWWASASAVPPSTKCWAWPPGAPPSRAPPTWASASMCSSRSPGSRPNCGGARLVLRGHRRRVAGAAGRWHADRSPGEHAAPVRHPRLPRRGRRGPPRPDALRRHRRVRVSPWPPRSATPR